ncbi:rod-binding protein [Phenylobacterium sp.]|uniref:rod-binding protein n=1 Tax=Phenylobacterium sp. TaxID=1871053 RepID=UPI002736CD31|nr:rod-binding protein [Phenylobacterium sp.]MDP3854625.1 rod-binding protein [Phenylobacterium sp.]
MADLAAAVVPPGLTAGAPAAISAAELAKRGQIEKTAKDFEASFLSVMVNQMFSGVSTEAPFGGGHGEAMFKSFLSDAIAKQMVKSGGVGVSDSVAQEMLKLQGLS